MKLASLNTTIICGRYGKQFQKSSVKEKRNICFPEFLQNENGLNITDKLEIANTFNDFFINVEQKLADKLVSKGQKTFTNFLVHKFLAKLKFHAIDKEEVIKRVENLKPKTSCGVDGISMKLVKSIKQMYW